MPRTSRTSRAGPVEGPRKTRSGVRMAGALGHTEGTPPTRACLDEPARGRRHRNGVKIERPDFTGGALGLPRLRCAILPFAPVPSGRCGRSRRGTPRCRPRTGRWIPGAWTNACSPRLGGSTRARIPFVDKKRHHSFGHDLIGPWAWDVSAPTGSDEPAVTAPARPTGSARRKSAEAPPADRPRADRGDQWPDRRSAGPRTRRQVDERESNSSAFEQMGVSRSLSAHRAVQQLRTRQTRHLMRSATRRASP
jgi:hypothetical protein